jgi:hypothetical protein
MWLVKPVLSRIPTRNRFGNASGPAWHFYISHSIIGNSTNESHGEPGCNNTYNKPKRSWTSYQINRLRRSFNGIIRRIMFVWCCCFLYIAFLCRVLYITCQPQKQQNIRMIFLMICKSKCQLLVPCFSRHTDSHDWSSQISRLI